MKMQDYGEVHEYGKRWWAFVVLSFSLLVIALDNTILNVALPTLSKDLGATASDLQWIVDAYTLVFAGLLLTMGSLSDRFGRKRALIVGLLVFGTGSVISAFSTSAGMLIGARALMGVGGAMIMPSTLSITTNIFSEKERGRAIGIWAGVAALGIIVGPLVGGLLLQHFAWGAVFLINVPFIVLTLLGSFFLVPESKDPTAPRLDPLGALLSIVGLTALVYAIIEVPNYGWGDRNILLTLGAAVLLLLGFVMWELRTRSPMLNLKLFKNPRFSAASLALTMITFSMYGTMFFLTYYLQYVLGFSPLEAGVRFIPLALGLMLFAPLSMRIAEFVGAKIVAAVGMAVVAGGFVLLSTVQVDSGYGLIATVLVILGAGFGLAMAPTTNSIMGALPLGKAGVGSAVNDTTRQVGGALGVAVLGSILAAAYHTTMDNTASLQRLPGQVREVIRDSINKAVPVAAHIGGPVGQTIRDAANSAFVDAMGHTVFVGAGVSLVGALIVLLFLPARAKQETVDLTRGADSTTMEEEKEGIPTA